MKTTIEIPDPVLTSAKKLAASEGTTLRSLVDEGLRLVLERRGQDTERFVLQDVSVGGEGLQEEARGASWEELRDLTYRGRGA